MREPREKPNKPTYSPQFNGLFNGSRYGWAWLHEKRFATDWFSNETVTNGNHGFLPMVFTQNNPGFSQFLDEFLCLATLTFCGHLPKRSNKLPAFVLSWYVHQKKIVFSSQNTEETPWKCRQCRHESFTMFQPQAAHFAFGRRGGFPVSLACR